MEKLYGYFESFLRLLWQVSRIVHIQTVSNHLFYVANIQMFGITSILGYDTTFIRYNTLVSVIVFLMHFSKIQERCQNSFLSKKCGKRPIF